MPQVGDRVRCIGREAAGCGAAPVGAFGTIVRQVDGIGLTWGIEFDDPFPAGHTLSGFLSNYRRGYWLPSNLFVVVEGKRKPLTTNIKKKGITKFWKKVA